MNLKRVLSGFAIVWLIGVTALFIEQNLSLTDEERVLELEKSFKKVVPLTRAMYICVDRNGNIHLFNYNGYSDNIILEYEEITEGMIDWEAINKDRRRGKK